MLKFNPAKDFEENSNKIFKIILVIHGEVHKDRNKIIKLAKKKGDKESQTF